MQAVAERLPPERPVVGASGGWEEKIGVCETSGSRLLILISALAEGGCGRRAHRGEARRSWEPRRVPGVSCICYAPAPRIIRP